jgi:hypothetical protein
MLMDSLSVTQLPSLFEHVLAERREQLIDMYGLWGQKMAYFVVKNILYRFRRFEIFQYESYVRTFQTALLGCDFEHLLLILL